MSLFDMKNAVKTGEELLAVMVADETEASSSQKILEISQQVASLRQKQFKQLKEDIQYLTSELNVEVGSSGDGKTEAEDLADVEASLRSRVEEVKSHSETIVRECQQIKEDLTKAKREQQKLKEQRQSNKDARTAALPKARSDVNLYSNITSLRWQLNCEPHEIKGFISSKNDVKTFNLNSKEVSKFFIINHLWDLIEEDW